MRTADDIINACKQYPHNRLLHVLCGSYMFHRATYTSNLQTLGGCVQNAIKLCEFGGMSGMDGIAKITNQISASNAICTELFSQINEELQRIGHDFN